jgi:hypothetical protein
MTDMTEGELAAAWNPRPPAKYEYRIDGIGEWTPSDRTSPQWLKAIEPALDLLTVAEVAFTLPSSDGDPVVIRYRKAQ